MKLSVIIPAYNAENTISDQLDALLRQDWGERWELIVADNGSIDATRDIVSRYQVNYDNVRLVDASQKRGPSFARNIGVKFAQGDFVAFCDADDEVGENWVRKIAEAIEEHYFVASRMDVHRKSDPEATKIKNNRQSKGLIRYTYVPYLSHAGTSGLGIRKLLHEKVGGFDESFVYGEDCDYCWKVQLLGYPLHFAREALIHVRHRETFLGQFAQGRNWGEYNVLLIKKYVPQGMPKPRLKDGLRRYKSLIKMIPRLSNPIVRHRFIWDLGYRVGHLIGSIRFGIVAL